MGIFISLIIPVYNVEDYLVQCLDSVANQIVPFDEVIIVNDGSTDHSQEICEKYVSTYKYFRLISQENKGLSAARNRGIAEASNDYIMFLDSDDCLKQDVIKILKKKLHKTAYDAIFFDAEIFFDKIVLENKKNIYDRSLAGLDEKVMTGEEYFFRSYPDNYIVSVCMAIYKTQLLKKERIFFPEGIYYEDNYFTFVFLEYAKKVIHISEKLYYRRYRPDSITMSEYSEKKFSDHIEIGLLIWNEFLKKRTSSFCLKEKLFFKYASDYYCMVLDRYKFCKKFNIPLSENAENNFKNITERYGMLLKTLDLEKEYENLTSFNQVVTEIHYTILYTKKNLYREKMLIQDIVKKQKCIYCELLKKIPLNKSDFRVGIYGTGKHTNGLLKIYEKLFGKVSCDLFFLDSYKDKDYIWGRDLINYKKIDLSTDLIVLSSFLYEQEMLENLNGVANQIPVYRFYDNIKKDIFSGYEAFLPYW